jgi:acetolactate synthase small subunit
MAAPPQNPSLSAEQRRALALLVSNPHGVIEELLVLAHGFNREMIAGLVVEGLATARREVLVASDGTMVELVRIRISDAGRRALEG